MSLACPKIRDDLIYEEDPNDEALCWVRDPLRRELFRFNILQAAMMQALDGKRGHEEIIELLGEEFGIELEPEKIDRFTERLRDDLLLDVSCYRQDDDRARREIRRIVARKGLVWRSRRRLAPSPEAALFQQGVDMLYDGDPCQAASYFHAVLELDPDNARARETLEAIQDGYLQAQTLRSRVYMSWRIWNPDRFLTRFDRRFGRFIYNRWFVLLMFGFCISAVPAVVDALTRPKLFHDFGVLDFLMAIVIQFAGVLVHEMGHGLSCKHYGGRVEEIGMTLAFGIMLAAYCDVSDIRRFPEKRHRIIVFASGEAIHLVVQAAMWHLYFFTDASFPFHDALLLALLFSLWGDITNLLPFMRLDGYFALSDAVGISDLRPRSFVYLRQVLQRKLFGVPSAEPEPSERDRKILLTYAIATGLLQGAYVFSIWIWWLLPLAAEYLGPAFGFLAAFLYFANLFGKLVLRHGVVFVRFLWRERKRVFTPVRTFVFSGTAAGITLVLSLPVPLHIDGSFELEPTQRAGIRATEPGIIASVRVREGDRVEKGDVIAVLRSDALERDRAYCTADLDRAGIRLEVLLAKARPEQIALAEAKLRAHRVSGAGWRHKLAVARNLYSSGVGPREDIDHAREGAARARGQAGVAGADLELLVARALPEEIAEVQAEVTELEQRLADLDRREAALELRSTIAGTVVGDHPEQQIGKRLEPGDALLEVVGDSGGRAEIVPWTGEPLGTMRQDQRVVLRARGDPHRIIEGVVAQVLHPESEQSAARVMVEVDLPPGWRYGMTGHARVYGPPRSVAYQYLALPVIRLFDYDIWRLVFG